MNEDVVSKGGHMGDSAQTAIELVSQLKTLPQPMVVIAGLRGAGKTRLAKMLAEKGLGSYINFGLTLSQYLIVGGSVTETGWTASFVERLASPMGFAGPLILDNIEAAFQPELQLNPLSWFLQMAREVPLVVVWPRVVSQGEFIYSIPNRPDYFRQRDPSVIVVNVDRK